MRNLLAAILVTGYMTAGTCAPYPPEPGTSARAYEGPRRPQAGVATVFVSDGRPHYEAAFICEVDDKPLPGNGCASVVYLLPGVHTLKLRYVSPFQRGRGEIDIGVDAGKLYQLNFTSFRVENRAMISVIPMYDGAKLVYRNIAPNQFPPEKLDALFPYDAD
jgi:hypothetical protein